MTLPPGVQEAPHRFDLFSLLRLMEREADDKPRIGDSSTLSEEIVALSQDPFLAFPSCNVSGASVTSGGTPRLHTRFLGMFGPQGALPLHMSEDARRWFARDPSFARFVDIVGTRFLQLFFRAWADARPIAQAERPADDRFFAYLASFEGIATPATRDIDTVDDRAKIPFAGLVNIHVKSAAALEQLLRGVFALDVEVLQWIGSWLAFEPEDRMRLGGRHAQIGLNAYLGSRAHTISERIRVRIRCRDRAEYQSLLPGQPAFRQLSDAIFFFCGHRKEVEIELGMPARQAGGAMLGKAGQLGWTAWVAPPAGAEKDHYYFAARFDAMARRGSKI